MNLLSRTGTVALLMLCTSRADAQLGGVLRRLPGSVGDAARAAEMLKQADEARRTPSPLAGTYRLTYAFGPPSQPTDSITLYARTFDKPATGTVGGDYPTPEKASTGQMTQGYMLTVVSSTTLDALPSATELASEKRSATGGGFALVYPFAGDSSNIRAFSVDWVLLLPTKTSTENDVFNKRSDRARSGGFVRADGSGKPRAVTQVAFSDASTVMRPDGSVQVNYTLRRGTDIVTVRGERISQEHYLNP
jgi:hypothetical protein